MRIVIDIDENVFTRLFDNGIEDYAIINDDLFKIAQSIRICTPLPENHGRLIDADSLFSWFDGESKTKYPIKDGKQYDTMMFYEIFGEIDNAPTIVEGTEGKE